MSKKKHKHGNAGAGFRTDYAGNGVGANYRANGMNANYGGHGMSAGYVPNAFGASDANAYATWQNTNPGIAGSMLHNLQGMLGSNRQSEQFIIGALIGAATVYVLGDEEVRAKLMKGVMRVYAGVAGSFEEIKEQMADIKAEVAAEKHAGV